MVDGKALIYGPMIQTACGMTLVFKATRGKGGKMQGKGDKDIISKGCGPAKQTFLGEQPSQSEPSCESIFSRLRKSVPYKMPHMIFLDAGCSKITKPLLVNAEVYVGNFYNEGHRNPKSA